MAIEQVLKHRYLLLARGRDRLETFRKFLIIVFRFYISYSLGDAIDWKRINNLRERSVGTFLLLARGRDRLETPERMTQAIMTHSLLLLARGRDRLETLQHQGLPQYTYRLLLARGRDRLETEHQLDVLDSCNQSPTR